jgi:hypothetical protein
VALDFGPAGVEVKKMSYLLEQASHLYRSASLISRSWIVSDSEVAGNSKVGQKRSYDQNGEGPLRAGSFLEVEGQPTNRPSCENLFDKDREGKSACYFDDGF